jgi:hypothetical protein
MARLHRSQRAIESRAHRRSRPPCKVVLALDRVNHAQLVLCEITPRDVPQVLAQQ